MYIIIIFLYKCMYVFLMVTLMIHMSCSEGGKGLFTIALYSLMWKSL